MIQRPAHAWERARRRERASWSCSRAEPRASTHTRALIVGALCTFGLAGCFMEGYATYLDAAADLKQPPGEAPPSGSTNQMSDARAEDSDGGANGTSDEGERDAGPLPSKDAGVITFAGMDGGMDAALDATHGGDLDAASEAAASDAAPEDTNQDGTASPDALASSCFGQEACAPPCVGPMCALDCADAGTCTTTCRAGENCNVNCELAGTCNVTCESGSTCDVHCRNLADCPVFCESGAQCRVICSTGGTCDFKRCLVGFRRCGAQVVCGMGAECI